MSYGRPVALILAALAATGGQVCAQSPRPAINDDFAAIDAQTAIFKAKQVQRCKKTGIIWIGMERSQLVACLGKPLRSFVTITAAGRHEQLIYRSGYVYVDNGVISGIQTGH